jgi:hypothetical protein
MKIRVRLLDFFPILGEGWVFLALVLFWAPVLLQDPASSLTPKYFVHISVFVHLCEAFLGIEPHFELVRHLFHLKPPPFSAEAEDG